MKEYQILNREIRIFQNFSPGKKKRSEDFSTTKFKDVQTAWIYLFDHWSFLVAYSRLQFLPCILFLYNRIGIIITKSIFKRLQTLAQDACDPSPCQNGGFCSLTQDGKAECACTPDFVGIECEISTKSCDPSPCKSGKCIPTKTGAYCQCEGKMTVS